MKLASTTMSTVEAVVYVLSLLRLVSDLRRGFALHLRPGDGPRPPSHHIARRARTGEGSKTAATSRGE